MLATSAVVVLVVAALGVSAGADPRKPPSPVSGIVTIDDGSKEVWAFDAWLEVPMNGATETVGPAIPEGKRLVVETISVWGNGSGPVTEDQGIERVELTVLGSWTIAVPLDRYFWGSCPGYEPPENCGNYERDWKYAGTESVRAYVDAGRQISAFAEHPGSGPGTQTLTVQVLGFLVPTT
jgi:hypothetical protein